MKRACRIAYAADLPSAMQSYVQALGLLDKGVCNYCHVEDRAFRREDIKVIARNMIVTLRQNNATFPDGKQSPLLPLQDR